VIASFEIEIGGRARTVAVERIGPAEAGRFRVTVDGKPRVVDAQRAGRGRLSLLFPDHAGASVDVALAAVGRAEVLVQLPSGAVRAVLNGRRSRRAADAGSAGGSGEQRITAPMPGRVVRVLVAPGDEVASRQPLVVVEAMKMENELSVARPGRVKDVPAREGMPVEAGRLLVVVGSA
jgi:biotin carboxyl carrier protein